jgi:hypothetical protein
LACSLNNSCVLLFACSSRAGARVKKNGSTTVTMLNSDPSGHGRPAASWSTASEELDPSTPKRIFMATSHSSLLLRGNVWPGSSGTTPVQRLGCGVVLLAAHDSGRGVQQEEEEGTVLEREDSPTPHESMSLLCTGITIPLFCKSFFLNVKGLLSSS